MIVIDASALAKYILREQGWRDVESRMVEGVHSLDLVVKEVANTIWRHSIKLKRIEGDVAKEVFNVLMMLIKEKVILLDSQDKYIEQAFDLSLSHDITIYDALYIAQAKHIEAKLLTSDRYQAEVAERVKVETLFIP